MNFLLMLGLPALALVVLYGLLAWLIALRMTRARRMAPDRARLAQFRTVRFFSRRDRVLLTASFAQAPHPTRAVILAHGRDHCRGQEFAAPSSSLVEHLLRHGFCVLLLDLRGHGESGTARLTYGACERNDVLGAVDWLLDWGFQPGQIGVIGASMGGVSAILAAAEEPAIAAVVADSAFAELSPLMRAWFRRLSGLPNLFLTGAVLIGRALIGVDLARLRPVEAAGRTRARMLVIHTLEDRLIPHSHAVALARAARAESWFTPGQLHLASFRDFPEAYAQRVTSFLEKHLRPDLADHRSPPPGPSLPMVKPI